MTAKKIIAMLAAAGISGAMFTACGKNDTTDNGMNGADSSISDSNPGNGDGSAIDGDNAGRSRDIDGDGFVEDVVTGAENIVDDIVTGADEILDDIVPNESDNSTVTTTMNE